jgi:hypothetical protein
MYILWKWEKCFYIHVLPYGLEIWTSMTFLGSIEGKWEEKE